MVAFLHGPGATASVALHKLHLAGWSYRAVVRHVSCSDGTAGRAVDHLLRDGLGGTSDGRRGVLERSTPGR